MRTTFMAVPLMLLLWMGLGLGLSGLSGCEAMQGVEQAERDLESARVNRVEMAAVLKAEEAEAVAAADLAVEARRVETDARVKADGLVDEAERAAAVILATAATDARMVVEAAEVKAGKAVVASRGVLQDRENDVLEGERKLKEAWVEVEEERTRNIQAAQGVASILGPVYGPIGAMVIGLAGGIFGAVQTSRKNKADKRTVRVRDAGVAVVRAIDAAKVKGVVDFNNGDVTDKLDIVMGNDGKLLVDEAQKLGGAVPLI